MSDFNVSLACRYTLFFTGRRVVEALNAENPHLTSNHDAKVPFGIDTHQGHMNKISKDTSCIAKSKMAADGHIGQHSQKIIFQKNYCNTCFPSNFGSLISFLTAFFTLGTCLIVT